MGEAFLEPILATPNQVSLMDKVYVNSKFSLFVVSFAQN